MSAPPAPDLRDPLVAGGMGPWLRPIPAGHFLMGAAPDEVEAEPDEWPRHAVTISQPFALGRYPVTRGEFRAFVLASGYRTEAELNESSEQWQAPGFAQGDDHPVVCIAWADAVAYCAWLAQQSGLAYRLPSEAQWEYACRAGSTTPFCWGERVASGQANFDASHPYPDGPTGAFLRTTVPVEAFAPNPWGLVQMHGNVWEWVLDGYAPYAEEAQVDPCVVEGELHVRRGGAFSSYGARLRSAFRGQAGPGYRVSRMGFRVARPM